MKRPNAFTPLSGIKVQMNLNVDTSIPQVVKWTNDNLNVK
jgi:hypothetical protein